MDYLYETITVSESILTTLPIPQTEYFNIGQGESELEELGTILADGGDRFGVSTVHFDPIEELIWMGNQGGHVTSYYGPEMQKYTSFQVHPNEPVRQIAFLNDGILCLTDTSLRYQLRRGIPKKTHRSKNMLSTLCMLSTNHDRLLIGGHQEQLIEFDLNTFTETSSISLGIDGCAVLRSHSRYLCCGNAFGQISLRDPNTYNEEHVISTHSGSLSDFDVQGNYLISCGYSDGRHGKLIADRHLLVYDLRMHRLISPIYTAIDPFLLHFLPLHCQRLAVVSPLGQLQLVDTVELSKPRICMYQINTSGAQCLSFDISSTTQAMVFGDQAGKINLVGSIGLVQPKFNGYSRPTEFADPIQPLPFVPINDYSFPMASIPLPKVSSEHEKLSSDMPEDLMRHQHLKPKPIDAEILENMKMKGPIGYALNPKKTIRNIIPYYQHSLQNDQVMTPINKAKTNHENGIKMIPKRYRKAEIKFSKVGTQDIDYDKYNQTDFIGLEAILPNAYCNPMLQVLYFINPLRKMLLSHSCNREHCISCELGFLFHMFDISSPPNPPCQASNFLRVFRTVPEASALGLILSDRNTDNGHNLLSLIQNWNRFVLHQIHNETMESNGKRKHTTSETLSTSSDHTDPSETSESIKVNGVQKRIRNVSGSDENQKTTNENTPENNIGQERVEDVSGISQLFGTKQDCVHRCLKCNEENVKSTIQMVCNLLYTPPKTTSTSKDASNSLTNGSSETTTFKKVLESSLCFDKTTPAWCESCKKFTPTNQKSKVREMPNILAVNTGLDNERHLEYLRLITGHTSTTPTNGISDIGAGASPTNGLFRPTNGILKQCRYGTHCSRIDCHFAHPERKSPCLNTNQLTSLINNTNNNNNSGKLNAWFPLSFTMEVNSEGQVEISNEITAENTQMTSSSSSTTTTNGISSKLEYMKIEESIKNSETEQKNGHVEKVTKNGEEKENLEEEVKSEEASTKSKNYALTAVVCHIDEGTHRNLVALINVDKSYHELKTAKTSSSNLSAETRWYLFNDFTVSPVSVNEAVWFTFDWKIPTICYYTATDATASKIEDLNDYVNPMTFELFKEPLSEMPPPAISDDKQVICKPPTEPFPAGYLVAMDAEFVTLNQEENEIRADGKMSTIKPKLQNAARITCIHGQGPHEGQPFMDDYISTHEQVVDYLTKYSGIKPGDLDAHFSNKRLTTLKKSYQKLRYLVDSGVIFVGHGLRNDFRVINMIVPAEQIVDTVYLFHIPHYRMISLRFLAWHFLGIKIQSETHDSIEDARTALLLYKHYLHLKARNALSLAISNLYDIGMQLMWKVPNN
ncbi:PAN2-PAN3 deadenylation complex catalytic subunit PAN2-like [Culicoides brevitarsis]|uniref:PAN2-PAN3 deadenylation complex catalytic subunit PAN2-like n=1 Tax=Culicoides brevitarsis TaxID=469753 RepID=UPI00307C100C